MARKVRQSVVGSALSGVVDSVGIDCNPNFNYDSFKRQAIAQLYAGKGFSGKDGVFGSMMSTPIINAPQSGILGMHNIVERPVVENGQIVIRPMMYLALSYDHRIIDGRESVSFLVRVKQLLENPEMMFDGKKPEERVLGL